MLETKTVVTGELEENCYIVYENGVGVVIDPGDNAVSIAEFLRENGIKAEYILLTHGHYDHIGAAEEIRRITGAPVLCSDDEKELLLSPELNLSHEYSTDISLMPDGTFSEGDKITAGDLEFKFLMTPGHTKGSAVIICRDNIYTGDTLFSGGYGRTDLPTGSFDDIVKSLRKLRNLDVNYKMYPGHGESSLLQRKRKHS